MTDAEFRFQVIKASNAELKAGTKIEMNRILPTVSIRYHDGEEYFFQEHEASDLLDRAKALADRLDLDLGSVLRWMAQSW